MTSKRWTKEDDIFLVRHHKMGADFIASHDLGFKSKSAGTKRVKLLKALGIWDAMENFIQAQDTMNDLYLLGLSQSKEAHQLAFDRLSMDGLLPKWVLDQIATDH